MKRIFLFLGTLAISGLYAQQTQVGINTSAPKATLDIRANPNAVAGTSEGILIPRISKEKVAQMTTPETSTLIYVNDISFTTTEPKVAHITKVGFYHYNGTEWIAGLGDDTSIYTQNGTLTENRAVDLNNNKLLFTGDGSIGINVPNPNKGRLEVGGRAVALGGYLAYRHLAAPHAHGTFMNLTANGGTYDVPNFLKKGDALGAFTSRDAKSQFESDAAGNLQYGGSEIYAHATENFSTTNKGSNLSLMTTANGTSQSKVRMLIDHNGNIGVNTTTPSVTLDVKGFPETPSALDGLMMPKLTGDQLSYKTYTPTEQGTLVYVTAPASPARRIGQTQNVTAVGYYSFNGTHWVNSGITTQSNGGNTIGVQGANYPKVTYTCKSNNVGQVLISVEGYFECIRRNSSFDEEYPVYYYHWSYTGIGYSANGTPISMTTESTPSSDIVSPGAVVFQRTDIYGIGAGVHTSSNLPSLSAKVIIKP